MIDRDGALLLLAIAFALAGVAALIPADRVKMPRNYGFGLFGAAFIAFLLAEFGDKTQFLAAGYAAVYPAWEAVALGTWLGVVLAMGVAVYGGRALRKSLPLAAIRKGLGGLLLVVAAAVSINAL
ncbi:MAG: TMEM165/GDT1 family protein [Sphingomonadales bacterium]|nr:TMEM165/GDT1 family protein [Sphingomonadales bacterium]